MKAVWLISKFPELTEISLDILLLFSVELLVPLYQLNPAPDLQEEKARGEKTISGKRDRENYVHRPNEVYVRAWIIAALTLININNVVPLINLEG